MLDLGADGDVQARGHSDIVLGIGAVPAVAPVVGVQEHGALAEDMVAGLAEPPSPDHRLAVGRLEMPRQVQVELVGASVQAFIAAVDVIPVGLKSDAGAGVPGPAPAAEDVSAAEAAVGGQWQRSGGREPRQIEVGTSRIDVALQGQGVTFVGIDVGAESALDALGRVGHVNRAEPCEVASLDPGGVDA